MTPRVREDNGATFSREERLPRGRAIRPWSPHLSSIELPCVPLCRVSQIRPNFLVAGFHGSHIPKPVPPGKDQPRVSLSPVFQGLSVFQKRGPFPH